MLVTQSCPALCNPMDCTCQAPLSMKLSRQEYWTGLPFPTPGDLPNLGIEPRFPALQTDSLLSELPGKPWGVDRIIFVLLTQHMEGQRDEVTLVQDFRAGGAGIN